MTLGKRILIGIGAILILTSSAFFNKGKPQGFRTRANHLYGARIFAEAYHDGVRKLGDNVDFDKDGENDLYLITNDGSLYHTSSKKNLHNILSNEKRWRKAKEKN